MAIIIDINESPSYKSSKFKSKVWNNLLGNQLDYISFVNASSYGIGSIVTGFTNDSRLEPLIVDRHMYMMLYQQCGLSHVGKEAWF